MDGNAALERLSGIREGLKADGYDIELESYSEHTVSLKIIALPDSCPDCLVPKAIMAQILSAQLGRDAGDIELTYPVDGSHH